MNNVVIPHFFPFFPLLFPFSFFFPFPPVLCTRVRVHIFVCVSVDPFRVCLLLFSSFFFLLPPPFYLYFSSLFIFLSLSFFLSFYPYANALKRSFFFTSPCSFSISPLSVPLFVFFFPHPFLQFKICHVVMLLYLLYLL